jgi:hypothetical protein
MTDKPPKAYYKLPDADAEVRFKRIVGNLPNTPHRPHKSTGPEAPKPD